MALFGLESLPFENYLSGIFFGSTVLQYLIFLGFLALGIIVGRLVYFMFKTIARRITKRTKSDFDDLLLDMAEEPIVFFIIILGFFLGYEQLTMPPSINNIFDLITKNLITIALFWFLIRILDKIIDHYLLPLTSKTKSDLDDHLVPLLKRIIKYSLIVLAIILILSNFGVNVTSLLAGLGIGGLAIALAAQELLRNILGGIAILTDKPFKLGDWIELNNYSGTVHEIGLRSTRLKTLGGEYVTVPNQIIASSPVINYKKFSRKKITFVLGLTYDTSAEKIEKAKQIIVSVLNKTNKVVKESYELNFLQFNAYSLDVDVRFDVDTNSGPVIRTIKDSVNREILKEFSKAKIGMAFPTQTIELKK